MYRYVISVVLLFAVYEICEGNEIQITPRSQWGAAPPIEPPQNISSENLPVPYVVIHHSAGNNNCSGKPCAQIVRSYQDLHMIGNKWNDIGYNFLIGPNGEIFEGRGWGIVGAHSPRRNRNSVGICLIGNFEEIPPTGEALSALKDLINFGVNEGKISQNFTMMGHNELQNTLCPGFMLFSVIQDWPHRFSDEERHFHLFLFGERLLMKIRAYLCAVFTMAGANSINITSREEWGAKPPKQPLKPIPAKYFPVPYTIIHHSANNTNCSNRPCAEIVREIQKFHQDVRGWDDIGYNFVVAPTGEVFEGRGWDKIGAQAPHFNNMSMGICLIGDFENESPTTEALSSTQELINFGTEEGQINKKYILLGHRQVRSTSCPGNVLYEIIQQWSHWKPHA